MRRCRLGVLVVSVVIHCDVVAWAEDPSDAVVLPTAFVDDRFFVVPTLANGSELRALADTGGGLYFFSDAADRLKMTVKGVSEDDYKGLATDFPAFAEGKGIPAPLSAPKFIPVAPAPVRMNLTWITPDIDGMLGETWFAGQTWTFDYAKKQLLYHPGKLSLSSKVKRIDMGLPKPASRGPSISYPRIDISVAGDTFSVLLATGSSVAISAKALKELGGGPAIRGTSLVSNSRMEEWRKAHPDWRYIPDAEERSGEPMIEVPVVEIGDVKVGPVWFTQRPDANFRETFSEWTDQPIDGALGPNALRELRVTLDYPAHTVWIEKP